MYKTASPYVKELLKGEIQWRPFTKKTLEAAIREDKVIFIHIGNIIKITEREAAYRLFNTREVIDTVNNHFIPIVLDTEDVQEAVLIALDMLIINEQKFTIPINVFSLPGIKPFISSSSLEAEDFLSVTKNIIYSFEYKRYLLEKASMYMIERLVNTGVIQKKEKPLEISAKLLHTYVKSWEKRIIDTEERRKKTQYLINARSILFFMKYFTRYNMTDKLFFIKKRLDEIYYSCMFDPIDGGLFLRATDSSLKEPVFEKSYSENIQAAVMFSFAYKYLKEKRYKVAAQRILEFIETKLKSSCGEYMTSITLNREIDESTYYRYSLKELKKHFYKRYLQIAQYLGMDILEDINTPQNISNTPEYWLITIEELKELKKIRSKKNEILFDKRVITAYNCMYASSLCIIAQNIKDTAEEYIQRAKTIIDNILDKQKNKEITLYRYKLSSNDTYLYSDLYDYSFFLNSVLLLSKHTKDEKYAVLARKYTAYILLNFYQSENGMFSKTSKTDQITPLKRESVMDYMRFSANSIMARNLFILHKINGDQFYLDAFKQQLYNIEPHLIGSGPLMTGWALQILNYLTDKPENDILFSE